jgi:hypothetical protein
MIEWSTTEFLKTRHGCPLPSTAILSSKRLRDAAQNHGSDYLLGADSAVPQTAKRLPLKYYPERTNPKVYKESHTFRTGGHCIFYGNAERLTILSATFIKNAKAHEYSGDCNAKGASFLAGALCLVLLRRKTTGYCKNITKYYNYLENLSIFPVGIDKFLQISQTFCCKAIHTPKTDVGF